MGKISTFHAFHLQWLTPLKDQEQGIMPPTGFPHPTSPLTVCLLQPSLRKDAQSPIECVHEIVELMLQAKKSSGNVIELFLLPELSPLGYSEDTFSRFLPLTPVTRNVQNQIDSELQKAARQLKAAICYGKIGWNEETSMATIRQVVLDKEGKEIAAYDKIHVCDYGDCRETRFFTPGRLPCSFSIRDWTFGLMICADMRYPMLAQTLVKSHGVHAILQPASFARDCSFRTWKSFRETRAVECGVYFLANNYAGDYFGQSSFNPPWIDEDNEPTVLETEVSWIVGTLDPHVLETARNGFPFYSHTMTSDGCPSCSMDGPSLGDALVPNS